LVASAAIALLMRLGSGGCRYCPGVAAAALSAAGLRNWCVNVGGDLVACGSPDGGRPWRAAVRDPTDPLGVALVINVVDGAVATSATYERGAHLWSRRPSVDPVSSLTVVGPKLAWADAFATAAFVMGREGVMWVGAHDGYEALAIDEHGTWWASSGFEERIADD
jgi:thiamine biosynthesis lipoprotein